MTGAGIHDLARPGHVVVLAPRWSRALAPAGDASLPRDGLVVLVAPPGVRRLAARALGRGGWSARELLLAVPDPLAPRYVAELRNPRAARAAISHHAAGGSRTRRLVAGALRVPGGPAALRRFAPRTSLLLSRPGGPRPYAWLDGDARLAAVTVTAGRHAGAVVRGWETGSAEPAVIAKVAFRAAQDGSGSTAREAGALARLGPAAAAAGATVPAVRRRVALDGADALVQDVVPGEPARAVLARDPARLPALLDDLGAWLLRWNDATRAERELGAADLDRWLLAPARQLTGAAGHPALQARAGRLAGTRVLLAAAHRDLTTDNVLLGAGGALGVVDWEHATPAWLPFTDFAYAAVDAIAAARGLHRAEALAAALAAAADPADPTGGAWRAHRAAHGRELETLGLLACFLHHAANELDEPRGGDGQFAAVARGLLRDLEGGAT